RDVEALRRGLGHYGSFGDRQVIDLGKEVVQESRVLAHRALGLPARAGGEVDVGELVGGHVNAEIAVEVSLLVRGVNEQCLDAGQRLERLIEHGGTGPFGEHEAAAGTGERLRDAVGREMRLDGQVGAAGLEDRQHGRQPVQIALGYDTYNTFTR